MLDIQCFVFNNFEENTYLVTDRETGLSALIDPGMLFEEEKNFFEKYCVDHKVNLSQVILTHGHLDHCFGTDFVRSRFGAKVLVHADDVTLLDSVGDQGRKFGMGNVVKNPVVCDVKLREGDVIELGDTRFRVIHVPGHTRGGIVLYDAEDKVAFVGDSIFNRSIGRTDLPGGDYDTLIRSLKTKILSLPDDTVLLSGHGDATTVGAEKNNNPYLKDF